MSTLGIIVLIVIGLIAYAFREQLMAAAAFIGIFMGIGALLFWWLFDNASLGATVGFWFAISYYNRWEQSMLTSLNMHTGSYHSLSGF